MSNFSVLICVYKNDDIKKFVFAMNSIYNNSLSPKEIILVIDGPVGIDLEKIINDLNQRFEFTIIRQKKNLGLAKALNLGIRYVSSEWIVRADADDVNMPNRFKELSNYMNENFDLIGSQVDEFDENGEYFGSRKMPISHNEIVNFIRFRSPFNHMSVAYKTSLVKLCGGYPDIYLKEDYALWCSMISKGAKTFNIDKSLVKVSSGDSLISRRGGLKYAISEFYIQRHIFKCGLNNFITVIIIGFSRALINLSPNFIRKKFYQNFLRVNNRI